MRFDIITIFPNFFDSVFSSGIVGRAARDGTFEINVHNLRDYARNRHGKTDDTPYGGGSGMLMTPGPIGNAVREIREKRGRSAVILTTPRGEKFDDRKARELSRFDQLVVVCGRYEGVDERVSELCVDMSLSTGQYVNSGGEYACSVMVDAVARYLPGVLGNSDSLETESFGNGLLEYPQYTKPETYMRKSVPEVLLSGNHGRIRKWRRERSIETTFARNPALLDSAKLSEEENGFLEKLKSENPPGFRVHVALVHHPVYNSRMEIVSTAFKSIDVHDISRDATTYGIGRFYLVNPVEEQRKLARRLTDHWTEGAGRRFNETKSRAFGVVEITDSIERAVSEIEKIEGRGPKLVATDARFSEKTTGYAQMRELIFENREPFLILFGTGSGLAREVMESADYVLRPISGYGDFNHLSVRSAAAITLDRLLRCGA